MGLLHTISRLGRSWLGTSRSTAAGTPINCLRICRFEEIESRRLMAADLHVGAVYYDPASGLDTEPNTIQISFEGGAPGSELTHLVIDGNKDGGPLFFNDAVFDTANGGLGAYGFSPLAIVSHVGFQVTGAHVEDGGTALALDFQGFKAGMKLTLSIDVDQVLFIDGGPHPTDVDVDAVDEGAEFQRSHFVTTFTAPHYYDVTTNTLFWDKFDANFAAAERSSGSMLDLPRDRYTPNIDQSVLTAGAVAVAAQVPLPSSLSGVAYADQNLNNHQDAGDNGIGGVNLTLYRLDDGQYVSTGRTTVTDSQGNYRFDQLLPGQYRVVERQPSGYFSVGATAGTVAGQIRGVVTTADIISDVALLGGDDSIRNDFAESLPNSISGFVGIDCEENADPPPIAGVVMRLLDDANKTVATTTTDHNGNYRFDNLRAGTYTVVEVQPAGYFQGDVHVGTAGGAISSLDIISQVTLTSGIDGVHYDFCELLPVSISGLVHVNTTGDCDDPNNPPLPGVTIHLLDSTGQVIATTLTDANGYYLFDNLPPGTYGVREVQPVGYLDGEDEAGSAGGTLADDLITNIVLTSGVDAVHYDFCELLPVSISGMVHVNTTGDCDNPENPPLPGVTIQLLDGTGHVIDTTFTDVSGRYLFENLPPGTYGVRELQPAGYFDDEEEAGSQGGTVSDDLITDIVLTSGVHAVDYNFCEVPPAELCGYVYSDLNNNGILDLGEQGIAGATLILLDANGQSTGVTTQTDAIGHYCFTQLRPGTYGVSEIQPPGYLDGLDTSGTAGGTAQNPGDKILGAVLTAGLHAEDYNFGELPPASIAGNVHARNGENCDIEDGATPLAGVVVNLVDEQGHTVATTTTNADGEYQFSNLLPGIYSVLEQQPAGLFDGDADVGSVGGVADTSNLISRIELGPGTQAVRYDFCEVPPASLSGFVFQDGPPIPLEFVGQVPDVPALRDGKLTPDDTRLAGVTLELRDGVTGVPILGSVALAGLYDFDLPITTVTDASGHYEFGGLPPGAYGVYFVQPSGYLSGIDTAGSLGGFVISPYAAIDQAILDQLVDAPQDDAIVGIPLISGSNSTDNNFSLVTTAPSVPLFAFPPQVPPPLAVTPAGVFPLIELPPALPPQFPFLVPPHLTRAGGSLYTWHLSIIDAGNPRGPLDHNHIVSLTAMRPGDRKSWDADKLDECEFILSDGTEADVPVGRRRLRFGLRGAFPISGDFNGDGKFEIGVFKEGKWYIDLNDNGIWDDGDLYAELGHKGDLPVTGDWDGDGKTDIGIYGPAWSGDPRALAYEPGIPDPYNQNTGVQKNIPRPPQQTARGERKMQLTSTGKPRADLIDHVFLYGMPGDFPIVGDWNGDGTATVAVFRDGQWRRDADGDGKWSKADLIAQFGRPGDIPVVGDFNGDGIDEVGIYRNGTWYIDTNGNGLIDGEDQVFQLGGPGDQPVVGDWNGDGKSEPGVYRDNSVPVRK